MHKLRMRTPLILTGISVSIVCVLLVWAWFRYAINDSLMGAASFGGTRTVNRLLAMGANVNAWDNGRTPLMYAVDNVNVATVKALLDQGADVNVKYKDGSTVLIRAASFGDINLVKLLLNKGANVNAKDNNGITALKEAVEGHFSEIVLLLKKAGAKK